MRRTCELDPRGFNCGGIVAHVCAALGCIEEQLEGARWRVRAMPADPGSWVTLVWALANNNRWEESAAAEQRIRELGLAPALALLPRASWRLGRRDAAVAESAQILRALGSDAGAAELERRGAASVEDTWRWLAELQAATWHAGIPNLHELIAARTYAELGDMDAALAALERSVASHEAGLELFGLDPIFDSIRDTPRFRALIEQLGLGAYHAKHRRLGP
jgi:tetratricopeptide (TPR) repeat protein